MLHRLGLLHSLVLLLALFWNNYVLCKSVNNNDCSIFLLDRKNVVKFWDKSWFLFLYGIKVGQEFLSVQVWIISIRSRLPSETEHHLFFLREE